MQSKYYTPKVEEFYSGFEYEYLTNGDEWIKHTIYCIADYKECIEDTEENKVRVKYLDKEDIESLDFIFDKDHKSIEFDMDNCQFFYHKTKMIRLYLFSNRKVYIRLPMSDGRDLFFGIINNKSELKRLFKQILYKYE